MHKITVDDIMEHKPCKEYPKERVEELWGGKESLSLLDILDLGIPTEDRIWAVTKFLSEEENGQFARWSALRVVHLWYCPDVVKQYLETGDEGLRDAARTAVHAAAWNAADASARASARAAADAAWDAWNAACTPAWNAAWNAARAAARGEEHQKQIEKLKELVK